MAASDNFDPRNPRIETADGGPPLVLYGITEAASQSFKAGELVYLVSNKVTVAATGDNPIFGIALKDATNTSSASALIEIPVAVIRDSDRLLMMVKDASGNYEAANTTCTPFAAGYDLVVASNVHAVNSGDTSKPAFVFLQEIRDVNGDASYWGRFKLVDAEIQYTHLT